MTSMKDLRAAAKAAGINSFGMSKEELIAAVGDQIPQSDPRAETRPTDRETTGRQARVPLGTPQQKLQAPSRRGYVRRWINDMDNRIAMARQGGYEHVKEEDGSEKRVHVGTKRDGSPMFGYLMEIREEFYNEDQARKQAENDRIDAAIRRGTPGDVEDPENFYDGGTQVATS